MKIFTKRFRGNASLIEGIHGDIRTCRRQGQAPGARQDLGRARWLVGSRTRRQPGKEPNRTFVAESNRILGVTAQVTAGVASWLAV